MAWNVEDQGAAGITVAVSGSITEDADFRPILNVAAGRAVCIDLAGVEQINSCGVREWIHFVKDVGGLVESLVFVRCSPAIVRQLNMISNFRGSATIRSVMLPYFCGSCSHEERVPFDIRPGVTGSAIGESITCPKCGEDAEFDDLASSYLAFAR